MMDILTGYRDKSVRNRISGVAVRLATVRTPKLGRRGRVIGAGWGGGRSIYSGGGGKVGAGGDYNGDYQFQYTSC